MRLPTRPGRFVPLVGAVVATAALLPAGLPGLLAAAAVPLFALASRYRWATLAHAGGLSIVLGVVLAGVRPGSLPLLLVATVASVVAWDAATMALALDAQVSPAATTDRAEAVHTGATLVVGAALAGLAYLVSLVGADTVPATVAIFAVGGAVALLVVLDPRPG